jgi:hypothetical protein
MSCGENKTNEKSCLWPEGHDWETKRIEIAEIFIIEYRICKKCKEFGDGGLTVDRNKMLEIVKAAEPEGVYKNPLIVSW